MNATRPSRRAVALGMAFGFLLPWRAASADTIGTIRTIATGLAQPRTAAVAANGDVYVTDTYHHQIRRLDSHGVMTTVAGTGSPGSGGDGGPATEASLDTPHGVAVDNRGHVFVADSPNHRIRMVDLATGTIRTVAGTGQEGFGGDGGPATSARLNRPRFLVVAPDGSLLIADTGNYRVRRVDPYGIITTVAGTGQSGYSGDGGPAIAARLDDPRGLALDPSGNLYVSNAEGSQVPSVRRIDPAGMITTVAGGRPAGFSGDGGPATEARLNEPRSIALRGETLFIADSLNDRIRAVDLRSGVIGTVAGTGASAYGGDGGPAAAAKVAEPRGVAVTPDGDLIVVDTGNDRLRRIDVVGPAVPGGQRVDPNPDVEQQTAVHPEAEYPSPAARPAGTAGPPRPDSTSQPASRPSPRPAKDTGAPRPKASPSIPAEQPAAPPPDPATPPTLPVGANAWSYGMLLLSVPVVTV